MGSECCKQAAKEYNTRHGWVGKMTHGVLSRRFKFEYAIKRFMDKAESVPAKDTHKNLWFWDGSTNTGRKTGLRIN